jgi:hypothetical protein
MQIITKPLQLETLAARISMIGGSAEFEGS